MATPVQIAGRVCVFGGNSSQGWDDTALIAACARVRAAGADTIIVKYADGGDVFHSADQMAHFHQVANDHGVGLGGFQYDYGPAFGWQQIATEANIANSMIGKIPIICQDMEQQYNGQVAAAAHFAQLLQVPADQLVITTWADPLLQNWQGVTAVFSTRATFAPQEYTSWLAAQPRPGEITIWPAVDLTDEFGPNDPVAIARQAKAATPDISVWCWSEDTINPAMGVYSPNCVNRLKAISSVMHAGQVPPGPPAPPDVFVTVTTWPDHFSTLSGIAAFWHVSEQSVYDRNATEIEAVAHQHGLANSHKGDLIFPGTPIYHP